MTGHDRDDWHTDARAQPWTAAALCLQVDPELFFPEQGGTSRTAKRVCAGCTVVAECLTYALTNGEHWGVWGGTTERERLRMRRRAA